MTIDLQASEAEPRSKHIRRVWIQALAAVVAIAFIWLAGEWTAQREKQLQVDAIHRTLEVQTLALRGTVARYNRIPFVSGQQANVHALLKSPRNDALVNQVNRYLEETNRRVGAEALYLMDTDGNTLAASNWQEPKSFVGDNYAFRPYFQDAKAGREGFFYAVGTSTGVPGLYLSTAVREGDATLGVMTIKVSLGEIEEAWNRNKEPVSLIDAHGIIFLGSVPDWKYTATRPLKADELAWVHKHWQYGDRQDIAPVAWSQRSPAEGRSFDTYATLDGRKQHLLALEEELPEFEWKLSVMSDLAPVQWARWIGYAMAALLALVLLLAFKILQLRERRYAEMRRHRLQLEKRVQERTAELQEAHAFRKAMGDSLVVGIHARDLQGRIMYVNPALCDITGYQADELVGQPQPYPYWHPEDLDKHWQYFDAVLSGQNTLHGFESRIRHREGHDVATMFYSAPLIDGMGQHNGWVTSVVDITDQKRAEEQQRLQAARMQRSGRLATMGEMASTLAHELNQPLAAIASYNTGCLNLLENSECSVQEIKPALEKIGTQAQRAGRIIRRVHDFVKKSEPKRAPCRLADVIEDCLGFIEADARKRQVRIECNLPALPMIPADHLMLEQVLLNLIRNGMDAMSQTEEPHRLLNISVQPLENELKISVADQGCGIAAEISDKLFTAFFSTKPEGMGVGLSICRSIIEFHRGRLWAEDNRQSSSGNGTIFNFTLPLESA